MRLRNKRTGKIIDVLSIGYLEGDATISVRYHTEDGYPDCYNFESLKEMNDTLGDYQPAEPLIKDEKIRKAVRAWAEACNIKSCYLECGEFCTKHREIDCCIGFGDTTNEMLEEKHYTIAELCGEKEE